jgi:hypothetical protein
MSLLALLTEMLDRLIYSHLARPSQWPARQLLFRVGAGVAVLAAFGLWGGASSSAQADVGRAANLRPTSAGARSASTAVGLLRWDKPGRYRFQVPPQLAGKAMLVTLYGGSGGGGDSGWVRGPGQGNAYTCQALKKCWGAGGGGGGASAVVGPGHFLLVATGGGGGGGGVTADAAYGSSGRGGNGGSGAELLSVLVPVAGKGRQSCLTFGKLPGLAGILHTYGCLQPGEVLAVVVGAGGQGAHGALPGAGGEGYGGPGGQGGYRCSGNGQSGLPYGGGGGGGSACTWGATGGLGGKGAYGGGGGAGTRPSSCVKRPGFSCVLEGGAGGGFLGQGAPRGTYRGVNGQPGGAGGGAGGAGSKAITPSLGAGALRGGAGGAGPVGGAGEDGMVTISY